MSEGNQTPTTNNPAKDTPQKYDGPKDARKDKKAGAYPNYWSHRTRGGHVFTMDDSKGGEHITLQHRGGSMIQFMPDGAVHFVSHNGQYTFIFGENRVRITGAYDVTVEGAASMKVQGDYNVNIKGKTNMNVDGDFNLTAKNFNQTIRGAIDVQAKSKTEKIEGSSSSTSQGGVQIHAGKGLQLQAEEGAVLRGKKGNVALKADKGKAMIQSEGKTSIKSADGIALEASSGVDVKGSTVKIEGSSGAHIKAGAVQIQATSSTVHVKGETSPKVTPPWDSGASGAESAGSAENASVIHPSVPAPGEEADVDYLNQNMDGTTS